MENVSKIKFGLFFFFSTLLTWCSFGQDDFFVFMFQGEPYLEVNDSIKVVTRGSQITKGTKLIMNRDDVLHFINDEGDLFELFETGTFEIAELQQVPAKKNNSSFARNLLRYAWDDFTNSLASRNNKSGVVVRGDDILLMRFPADSIQIFANEVRFEWKPIETKEKDYYFILKDKASGKVTVIGTPATTLALGVDDNLLKPGGSYQWAITETRYANLDKTTFYDFKLLTQEEFGAKEKDIKQLTKDLLKLGFDKKQVRQIICSDYKVCY